MKVIILTLMIMFSGYHDRLPPVAESQLIIVADTTVWLWMVGN